MRQASSDPATRRSRSTAMAGASMTSGPWTSSSPSRSTGTTIDAASPWWLPEVTTAASMKGTQLRWRASSPRVRWARSWASSAALARSASPGTSTKAPVGPTTRRASSRPPIAQSDGSASSTPSRLGRGVSGVKLTEWLSASLTWVFRPTCGSNGPHPGDLGSRRARGRDHRRDQHLQPSVLRGVRGPRPRRHVRPVGALRPGQLHPSGLVGAAGLGRGGSELAGHVPGAAADPVHPHRRARRAGRRHSPG